MDKIILMLLMGLMIVGDFSKAATTASTPAKPAATAKTSVSSDKNGLKFTTPSPQAGQKLVTAVCAACHGPTGVSQSPATASLAGQTQYQLRSQLVKFRNKSRPSNVMQAVAGKLTDQQIVDVAAYFSGQQIGPAWKADAAARKSGQQLFTQGDPKRNIMACAMCHGADGRGLESHGVASVTNLPPEYAYNVLKEFHDVPSFGGQVEAETMRIVAKPMNDKDLKDLAAYISSMK